MIINAMMANQNSFMETEEANNSWNRFSQEHKYL